MTATEIHIDPEPLLVILGDDGANWTKGSFGDGGPTCLHGAIRRCSPKPGDAHLIQRVADRQGWGVRWNDDDDTTWADVRARINGGIDVTDADLAATFGPSWRAVVWVVRTVAAATPAQIKSLAAAADAAADDASGAAAGADWDVAWDDAWDAASAAAAGADWGAAAGAAAGAASGAVVLDLVGQNGLIQSHVDTLMGPFVAVFGPIPEEIR